MKLNPDQEMAFNKLKVFFADPNARFLVVRGPGGTGKTKIISEFVKQHPKIVGKVVLTAPTNAAVEVLENFGKEVGRFVPTKTIYSLMGLVLGNNGEVKRTFSATEGSFDEFDTIVIDEGSMAGRDLTDVVEDRALDRENVKVVVMGDPCQLNPVNETISSMLEMGEIVDLTIDMRSGNGPLLSIKREIRDLVLARNEGILGKNLQVVFETKLDEDGSGVHFIKGKEFEDAMLDMFDTPEYKANPKFCRVLAWTNKEVDRLNRLIRTRIYGKGCEPYMVGEMVAVLTPVYEGDQCIFATDTETEILGIEEAEWVDYTDQDSKDPTYKVYRVTLRDNKYNNTYVVPVMHKESERKFRRRCDFLSEECRSKNRPWKTFWAFHDSFVKIRPVHAMTVHKSQGQTFGCTFVNLKDVMGNKNTVERARLGYVATSRPTTDLVVNLKTFY